MTPRDAVNPQDAVTHGASAGAPCANCGRALVGPYCATCGQRDAPLDPSVRELAVDAAQEVLGFDGTLIATVRRLVLRPGQLTVDHLAGRRAASVRPVRVYLACSVLVFAILSLQPRDARPRRVDEFQIFGVGRIAVDLPDSVATRLAHAPRITLGERVLLRLRAAIRAGPERRAQLEQRVTNTIPQTFFLIVPAYAAVLWLVAPRPRRHYPAHLVYALHVQALAFAALSLPLATRAVVFAIRDAAPQAWALALVGAGNAAVPAIFSAAEGAVAVYVLAAYRRVYGGSWPAVVARVVGSTTLYVLFVAVALAALMGAVLLFG